MTYSGSYFKRRVSNLTDYSYYTVAYDSFLGSYATYFPTGNPADPFLDPTQQWYSLDHYTKETHELRVSSPARERIRLTAGLFLERQTDDIRQDFFIPGLSTNPDNDLTYVHAVPGLGDDTFSTRARRVDRDYAVFAEASFDLLPRLTLTGGIRGYMYRNTLVGRAGFGVPRAFDSSTSDAGETHKANLTWKIDPHHMLYATYSTGFRPGGTNRTAGFGPYRADTLDNYEVGFKTSWFRNMLRVNGALFLENWNDAQLTYSPPGVNGALITTNVPSARSKGVEADASLALGRLTLSGSGTYTDAYTTKSFASAFAVTPAGTRLPIQPRFKVNGTARYTLPVDDLKPYVQATVNRQSSSRSFLLEEQFANVGTLPGFTSFDFAAGLTLPRLSRLTIELFAQNAFDAHGQLSRNSACTPSYEACGQHYRIYPLKPQLFGLRVGQRF